MFAMRAQVFLIFAYNRALFVNHKHEKRMEKQASLNKQEILALRARAHHLNPVVMVGQHGLTEAVIRETETALRAHELIKVRVLGDERDERDERLLIGEELCAATGAQLVQHIGKLLVLYRERSDDE